MAYTEAQLRQMARNAARTYNVDPDIFERQIDTESKFNPNARNPKSGADGIAQIMVESHPTMRGKTRDPVASLDYAARWMGQLIAMYSGNVARALAAYNWGPGNVNKWDGKPESLPAETRKYLGLILGGEDWGNGGFWDSPLNPLPSAGDFVSWLWQLFDGIRTKVKEAVVGRAEQLAIDWGGPVSFWVIGITLISWGILGISIAAGAAAIRGQVAWGKQGLRFLPGGVGRAGAVVGAIV